MKKKPIIFINHKHDAARGEKLGREVFDLSELISQDEGNALSNDLGFYYSRCACKSYRYVVIATQPYPKRFAERYQAQYTLSAVERAKQVERYNTLPKEGAHATVAITSGTSRAVTGYLTQGDQTKEGTHATVAITSGSSRQVTGYLSQSDLPKDGAQVGVVVYGGTSRTVVTRLPYRADYRAEFSITAVNKG